MNRKATPWGPVIGALAPLLMLSAIGCSTADPPLESQAQSQPAGSVPATAVESAGDGGTQELDAGGLEAGTRYVIESLGISIRPDVDGWFALLPQGGDAGLAREGVSVYILAPNTVLAPDGTQTPAPADPQSLVDAVDATAIVDILGSEAFEANGISGISAELEASGGSAAAPLLTTGSGEWGLVDGEFQWIVIEVDGRPIVLSVEQPDDPDIDAAWAIAGPLVESLEPAP
jgi:hypothetical protein